MSERCRQDVGYVLRETEVANRTNLSGSLGRLSVSLSSLSFFVHCFIVSNVDSVNFQTGVDSRRFVTQRKGLCILRKVQCSLPTVE